MTMSCKAVLLSFFRDESGQDLIEYALIAALIAAASIASMTTLAGKITAMFTAIGGKLIPPP